MARRICGGAMRWAWISAVLAALCPLALAGPPFQTDDPEPVEYHHFEMYAFELSDTTSGGTTLEVPAYEVNWGAAPGLQLHLVVPLVANFPSDGSTEYGIGDTELGAKYRFVKEKKWMPEVGIFPFIELPSGNSDKGLGAGTTWYRLPLWLQKSWGPWTTYGGGGEAVVPGSKDYPFAGWLVQRQINKKLTLGGELFGHGQMAPDSDSSTMLDAGGIYEFRDGFDLLFTAGHSVAGQSETYTYLALYWTWGPKDTDAKESGGGLAGMLKKMRLR